MSILELLERLILVFGTPTVVIGVSSYFLWWHKKTEDRLSVGNNRFNTIEGSLQVIGRVALRLEITNSEIPIAERIHAYHQYKNQFNGNGYMDEYYNNILRPLAAKEQTGQD